MMRSARTFLSRAYTTQAENEERQSDGEKPRAHARKAEEIASREGHARGTRQREVQARYLRQVPLSRGETRQAALQKDGERQDGERPTLGAT